MCQTGMKSVCHDPYIGGVGGALAIEKNSLRFGVRVLCSMVCSWPSQQVVDSTLNMGGALI
jgi:hypothetical protein